MPASPATADVKAEISAKQTKIAFDTIRSTAG
jgi:hypothetical protein